MPFLVMKGKTKAKLVLISCDEMSVFVKEQYISALLCNSKLGNYFAPLWRYVMGTALGHLFFVYGFVPQLWALPSNPLAGKSHTDFPGVLPAWRHIGCGLLLLIRLISHLLNFIHKELSPICRWGRERCPSSPSWVKNRNSPSRQSLS